MGGNGGGGQVAALVPSLALLTLSGGTLPLRNSSRVVSSDIPAGTRSARQDRATSRCKVRWAGGRTGVDDVPFLSASMGDLTDLPESALGGVAVPTVTSAPVCLKCMVPTVSMAGISECTSRPLVIWGDLGSAPPKLQSLPRLSEFGKGASSRALECKPDLSADCTSGAARPLMIGEALDEALLRLKQFLPLFWPLPTETESTTVEGTEPDPISTACISCNTFLCKRFGDLGGVLEVKSLPRRS
mmetsp:Transcript_37485/g.99638  ORF Transcript_37485/g.99638 Transcript_37485/m.99638 type:complete len:244 (+) Transcript_37485:1401-2132(+)